ncbi:MAG TPA: hypothetical protein VFG09_12585, partial [Thermodesulfovibrionales bacterium]|nr:hypothetical protein [Thermodesulfovibrionales bacterium]
TKTVFAEPEEYITKSGAKYAIASISEFTGISVMFPRDTAKAVMTGALERDFPDVKNIDPVVENNREGGRIGWLYDREGYRIFVDPYYRIDVRKIELFLLVFAYPLSVLIRFIVRKIRPSGITV